MSSPRSLSFCLSLIFRVRTAAPLTRAFLTAVAVAGIGCSGGSDPSEDSDEAKPEVEKVTVLGWVDYFPEGVFEQFTAQTGIEVEYVGYDNGDEPEALLEGGGKNFDIVLTDGVISRPLLARGLFQPIQQKLIPNFANLDPGSLDLPSDPGNRYTAPFLWGTILIAYNRDLIPEPQHSWSLLSDPEARGGPALVIDEEIIVLGMASAALGDDINDPGKEPLTAAVDHLENLARDGHVRFAPYPEVREALINGDCAVAVLYNCDVTIAAAANDKISYFVPEEGAPRFMDSFLITRNSQNPAAAHRLIDFILGAEVGVKCAVYNGGGAVNRASMVLMEGQLLSDALGVTPSELESKLEFVTDRSVPPLLSERLESILGNGDADSDLDHAPGGL